MEQQESSNRCCTSISKKTNFHKNDYDANRNVISEIDETFSEGETSPSSMLTLVFGFDDNSNRISQSAANDANGDGQIDETSSTTTTYAEFNAELTPNLVDVLVF